MASTEMVVTERIDPDRAAALAGVLDLDPLACTEGSAMRPMWQVAFLLPRPRQSELGPDGHPLSGIPTPPKPPVRRMFVGGRLRLTPGLRLGEEATARTWCSGTSKKIGRIGTMTLATVKTETAVLGNPVLVEERDIMYLPADRRTQLASRSATPVELHDAAAFAIDPTVLFRFSAVTWNAHRIHYDRDYATTVEGYPSLVVHGPLQALVLAERATGILGWCGDDREVGLRFEYRLHAPLLEGEGMLVGTLGASDGDAVEVGITDDTGRLTASGRMSLGRARP